MPVSGWNQCVKCDAPFSTAQSFSADATASAVEASSAVPPRHGVAQRLVDRLRQAGLLDLVVEHARAKDVFDLRGRLDDAPFVHGPTAYALDCLAECCGSHVSVPLCV